jgi:hypothetical protein
MLVAVIRSLLPSLNLIDLGYRRDARIKRRDTKKKGSDIERHSSANLNLNLVINSDLLKKSLYIIRVNCYYLLAFLYYIIIVYSEGPTW